MAKFERKKPKKGKKWVVAAAAVTVAAAAGAAAFLALRGAGDPVSVYHFSNLGMTEFWGDNQESHGPVSTDKIQTVFLTDTQTVTEVMVEEGQEVKKGDVLLTFDTTLSELQLERKRLTLEKEKFQLTQDEAYLEQLYQMRPREEYVYTPPQNDDPGRLIKGSYELSDETLDGTEGSPVICWMKEGYTIDEALLETIYYHVYDIQKAAFETLHPEATQPSTAPTTEPTTSPSSEATTPSSEAATAPSTEPTQSTTPTTSDPTQPGEPTTDPSDPPAETQSSASAVPETTVSTAPTVPKFVPPEHFYVIFRSTEDNRNLKPVTAWVGLHVYRPSYGFKFFETAYNENADWFYLQEHVPVYIPPQDPGSGYTAAELGQMRANQREKIKQQDYKVRVAENEYNIMKAELNDGNIVSQIDGKVVSLLSEEEAKANRQPMVKVSGGGGFLIRGSVSELEKDNMAPGQEVTVNDWNTGMAYTGQIREIGDFPVQGNGWTGMGNPNATYYPFTVFVDETADLQAGSYANIQYSSGSASHGIYLENPFLRTEEGKTYVLVRGEDGRLEKRYVTVGKALWGSYTEILSGVTEEDYLAFPYAKEARPGVATKEGDVSELYAY